MDETRYRVIAGDGTPREVDTLGELIAVLTVDHAARACMDPVAWVDAHRRAEGLPSLQTPSSWHPRNVNAPPLPEKRAQSAEKRGDGRFRWRCD